ncbi:hypothetical protein [Spirosoma harenae]
MRNKILHYLFPTLCILSIILLIISVKFIYDFAYLYALVAFSLSIISTILAVFATWLAAK